MITASVHTAADTAPLTWGLVLVVLSAAVILTALVMGLHFADRNLYDGEDEG